MAETGYQPPDGYMTLGQAQQRLGVSRTTMNKRVKDGELAVYRNGRDTRVRLVKVDDVERLAQPQLERRPHPDRSQPGG